MKKLLLSRSLFLISLFTTFLLFMVKKALKNEEEQQKQVAAAIKNNPKEKGMIPETKKDTMTRQ